MAGLGEIPLPADPSWYIGWKLKLTVEKRWGERGGVWQAERSFAKAAGGQTESSSEGAQCDSALT